MTTLPNRTSLAAAAQAHARAHGWPPYRSGCSCCGGGTHATPGERCPLCQPAPVPAVSVPIEHGPPLAFERDPDLTPAPVPGDDVPACTACGGPCDERWECTLGCPSMPYGRPDPDLDAALRAARVAAALATPAPEPTHYVFHGTIPMFDPGDPRLRGDSTDASDLLATPAPEPGEVARLRAEHDEAHSKLYDLSVDLHSAQVARDQARAELAAERAAHEETRRLVERLRHHVIAWRDALSRYDLGAVDTHGREVRAADDALAAHLGSFGGRK